SVLGKDDMGRRPANTHRGSRRINFHAAGFRNLPGHESEATLDQVEEARVRAGTRAVYEFVQFHACAARKIEGGAVGKSETEFAVRPGLDEITPINRVANFQTS